MTWTKNAARVITSLLLCCLTLFAGGAAACMVCIPFPEDTATDLLQGAEVVVLARENPDKPFSYLATEVLKGELEILEIDLFVDSATRRRLKSNPGQAVVLARGAAADSWRSAGYASESYGGLVREILLRTPEWRDANMRARFFMPYLAAAEPAVRELAYLEVGRASYDTIREADPYVPADQIYRFLANTQYLEWQPLYILLLGIDASAEEAKTVRSAMASSAQFSQGLNLSAWATALIEVDGVAGIEWLERQYLGQPGRDRETVKEIVKALSVQGASRHTNLRRRIAESYAMLIETHPALAGWAARDLTAWKDWRYATALETLREKSMPLDAASTYAIDYYIGRARAAISN